MKINIGYDTKSIDKAIKQIEEYQKKVQALIPTFLQRCAERIIQLANQNIDTRGGGIGLGGGIIAEIKDGWYAQPVSITKKGASITIRNRSEKATYIEFGVGQRGASSPHDKASKLYYGYDINSHGENGWYFYAHNGDANVDIGSANRDWEYELDNGTIKVFTKGQEALMFAYQAVMDFAQSREPADIMEDLLKGLE